MTHIIVVLLTVLCFFSVLAQSPCPEYFEYVREGNAVYGMIHLISDGRQLSSLTVQANFTIATQLHSNYVGRLEPVGDDLLLISFNAGHSISFRVHFPTTSPLPKLTALTANGAFICGGPPDVLGPGKYVTTISLQSLLYLKSTGGSNYYPNFVSKPMDNKKVFIINNNKKGPQKPTTVDFMYYNIDADTPFPNRPQILFENPSYINTFNTESQNTFQNIPNRNPTTQQTGLNQNYPWEQNTQNTPQQNYPFNQMYPSQNTNKYPNQQNPSQNYPNQQNPSQNYPNQQNPSQNYPNQQNPSQNYPNQQNPSQNYPNQLNPSQNYPNQQNPQIYPTIPQTEPPKTNRPTYRPTTVATTTTTEAEFNLDERYPSIPTPRPQTTQSTNIQCGVSLSGNERIPLIYKGESFTKGEWPWLVALYKRKDAGLSFVCSGTLISDRHVISAAHCMRTKASYSNLRDIVIKVGVYNLEDWGDDGIVTRTLTSVVIHESYNASTLAHDILLAKFDKRVQFNDNIRPACLWAGSTDITQIVGSSGIVVGWGASESSNAGHGAARAVSMPVVSTAQCRASRPDFHHLTSAYTLCAGDRNGAGPCLGDSGGGLYMMEGGRWRIRAVVSLSLRSESNSCNLNEYVVFTDAAQYLAWISYNMNT